MKTAALSAAEYTSHKPLVCARYTYKCNSIVETLVVKNMPKSNFFVRVIFGWMPLVAICVVLIGFAYVAAQQVYRAGANDPQIQMAEDAALKLAGGAELASVIPVDPVAIETSLAPYVIVYSADGRPSAGNGSLHGGAPVLPAGVLEAAKSAGENRLTWQPEEGVRQAIVIVPYQSGDADQGYVMVGRSLREVEDRVASLTFMAALALLCSLAATLLTVFLKEWLVS